MVCTCMLRCVVQMDGLINTYMRLDQTVNSRRRQRRQRGTTFETCHQAPTLSDRRETFSELMRDYGCAIEATCMQMCMCGYDLPAKPRGAIGEPASRATSPRLPTPASSQTSHVTPVTIPPAESMSTHARGCLDTKLAS